MNFILYGKQTISEDDINSVIGVLKSNFLTTGPKVKEFEEKIKSLKILTRLEEKLSS